MEHKIMEYAENAWAEIRKAEKMFEELNDNDATYSWKYDELRKARKLFDETLSKLSELETFFCEGDELLPQEELERLEREQLEDLVAEEMLESEG
jgi:hypothetical protein